MLSLAGLLIAPASADATGFTGHTIGLQVFYPDLATPISELLTAVVDDSVEIQDLPSASLPGIPALADITFDFSESSIFWQFVGNTLFADGGASFNGVVISDPLGEISRIVGVSIDSGASSFLLPPERLTWTQEEIRVNLAGLDAFSSPTLKLDVVFAPEPSTVQLLATGLLLAGLGSRPRPRAGVMSSAYAGRGSQR